MNFILLQLLLLVISPSFVISKKLNYPRVLLPIFQEISIQFTLEASEKGCFKWTSSRNDLIQISPIYNEFDDECSYKAIISVLTRDRTRNTAFVHAEDLETQEILRCDVILDVIHSLDVKTTTRELFLEEAPETFELIAEDTQGNIFTTLENVQFVWTITSQNNVLRFIPFSESKYHEVPKSLEKFESLGLKGYMVLLEGINTGTAKVSIQLPYPEYSHVPKIEVDIMVLANIILDPSEVHIMVGDTIEFRILQLKKGKLEQITSSNQYYLEVENKNLATISGSSITGKKLGRTSVILCDRNVLTETSSNGADAGGGCGDTFTQTLTPKAILTVTVPDKITINLLPHYNWVTVEGEKHEIAIDLFTSDDQKIWLGPRYKITSEFDEYLFYVLERSNNGSRIYGETLKNGSTTVIGKFEKLNVAAEMQIYKELVIHPKLVILPLNSKQHKVEFKAEGGDGQYRWSSANPNLIYISQNGIAETKIDFMQPQLYQSHHQEKYPDSLHHSSRNKQKSSSNIQTNVRVAMKRNTKIFRTAEILFVNPVKLEIVKYNFETALHDYVHIHIALYGKINDTLVPFTLCENLNFDFEFTDPIFEMVQSIDGYHNKLALNACHVSKFRAINLGMTYLRVSYTTSTKTILIDEITLNVFEKLQILSPQTNEIVLPIGSSRNVIYINGPQKLYNIDADLLKVVTHDKSIVKITELQQEENSSSSKMTSSSNVVSQKIRPIYILTILCRKIGNTEMKFQIFNSLPSDTKNVPYISEFITNIYCVKPRFLRLYSTEKVRPGCPIEVQNSLIHLKNNKGKNIEIEIEVLDKLNRKLMNITSLVIEWQFFRNTEKLQKNMFCHRDTEEEIIENIKLPNKDYLICSLIEITPNFKIKGIVKEYDSNVLRMNEIKAEVPNFGVQKSDGVDHKPVIENEINFIVINTTVLPFSSVAVFLSKNREERIPITQGSGFYEFKLSEESIISVGFDPKTQELIIKPHKTGHVEIEITDRCLMIEPTRLLISVVTIHSIKINILDRVQLYRSIEAVLTIYDSDGNILNIDHNNLEIYEINYQIYNPSKLSIHLMDKNLQERNKIRYKVTGTEIGETKIIFYSGYGDDKIASSVKTIQIFPPLRLNPRNSTLIIGSSLQIHHQDGPYPDTNIVFTIHHQNIVSIDSGVVMAKEFGSTKITGKCIGTDPVNGKQVVFSEDTIEVHVVQLEEIRIRVPLIRIKSGATMPMAIWGVPDLSPMVLGTLDSLRIMWSVNQREVVDIYGPFSELGIEYNEHDLISVYVCGNNPGKARIHATLTLPEGRKLTTSIEITVFSLLELVSPKKIRTDSILMAPRSTIKLKANMDDAIYTLENRLNGVIKVSQDGFVKSSDVLGRDLVIVKTVDQSLSVDVEVRNIHYILTTVMYPSIKLRQVEERIPRGMKFLLKVSLHDNLGNELSHSIENLNAIKYELSHNEMVTIQSENNLTLSVSLYHQVNNMLRISLEDNNGVKYAENFIKIATTDSEYIFPKDTLFTVGDMICFESPLTSTIWSSSNDKMLSIDKMLGFAKILDYGYGMGENKAVVISGDKNFGNHIKFDIEIRDSNKIQFLQSTYIFTGKPRKAHLVIRNHLQLNKTSNVIARNISNCLDLADNSFDMKLFSCRLISKTELGKSLVKQFHLSPIFDKIRGLYACNVELRYSTIELISDKINTNDVSFELEAKLKSGIIDTTDFNIITPISVLPSVRTVSVQQIINQGIHITGSDKALQSIVIEPSDDSLLNINLLKRSQGSLHYTVNFLKETPLTEEMFINIQAPQTEQLIKISIVPEPEEQTCKQGTIFSLTNFGFTLPVIILICLSTWFVMFYVPQRQYRIQENPEVFNAPAKSPLNQSISNLQLQGDMNSLSNTSIDSYIYGNSTSTMSATQQRRSFHRYL